MLCGAHYFILNMWFSIIDCLSDMKKLSKFFDYYVSFDYFQLGISSTLGFMEAFSTGDFFHLIGNWYGNACYKMSSYEISVPWTSHAPPPPSENPVSASEHVLHLVK